MQGIGLGDFMSIIVWGMSVKSRRLLELTWLEEEGMYGGGSPSPILIKIRQHLFNIRYIRTYGTWTNGYPRIIDVFSSVGNPNIDRPAAGAGACLSVCLFKSPRRSISHSLFALSPDFMIWKMNRRISCLVVRWMGFQIINLSVQHALHTVDTRR